MLCETIN